MKKIIIPALIASVAMFTASCSTSLLEEPQKGVTPVENFYQTNEDAEGALTAAYAGFVSYICSQNGGSIYSPYRFLFNLCADDMYAAGEFFGDNDFAAEMNEFRYDSGSQVIDNAYKNIFLAMYPINLVIDKFKNGLPEVGETPTTKRVVAEARVLRAYLHMMLAIGWGNPPFVDSPLNGDALPLNCNNDPHAKELGITDQKSLLLWCAKECEAEDVYKVLNERESTTDKNGVAVVTKGFADAVAGKSYLFAKEYEKSAKALKRVIDSGKYALVDGSKYWENFHIEGDCNEEKIFEGNIESSKSLDLWGNNLIWRTTWMEANIWNWRSDHFVANPSAKYSSIDGWGGCGVPQDFADALIENDGPNSNRVKATIIPIDSVVYGMKYGQMDIPVSDADNYNVGLKAYGKVKTDEKTGKVVTKEVKYARAENDTVKFTATVYEVDIDAVPVSIKKATREIGIGAKGLYGQSFYLPLKPVTRTSDLIGPGNNARMNNFTIMRYAEVLLMYAEACLQSPAPNKAEALKYIVEIQRRAGVKDGNICTEATMDVLKKEKEFELWLEGCRWPDMVRWGDFTKAEKAGENITILYDKFYRPVDEDDENVTFLSEDSRFYTVRTHTAKDRGYTIGFKKGKHEFFPFPANEMSVNPNLVQNPNW